MKQLVLVRHGESEWNKENRFTGWTDVDLSEEGWKEAHEAGRLLKEAGFTFDKAYTSVLKRANHTLDAILEELEETDIPVIKTWKLNERHYGALQGLNKAETAKKYGEEQVLEWRRGYDVMPPLLQPEDGRAPANQPLYKDVAPEELPLAESLKTTIERVVPYWTEVIEPEVQKGERVIVAAHGNSLRALVKHLDGLSDEEIMQVNIPTGVPLVYEFDDDMHVLGHHYLGDEKAVAAKMAAVASQGKAKK